MDYDPYSPIPSLGNREEMEKVFILPSAGSIGPYAIASDTIVKGDFLAVDYTGWVRVFRGCPVHSKLNSRIVAKALEPSVFGKKVLINFQFNIRTDDCLCEVDDIQV